MRILLVAVLAVAGCSGQVSTLIPNDGGFPDGPAGDGGGAFCAACTTDDCDGDTLTNVLEQQLGTDPCSQDSDGDNIPDGVEVNAPKICVASPEANTPRPLESCETDADCSAGTCQGFDPTNSDQDGDGVLDGEEDRDLNGLIGDCKETCAAADQCGDGQTCDLTAGKCTPVIANECIGSETDPRLVDTDGDGIDDVDEGSNLVCNTAALINPTLDPSSDGDWTLALDPAFGTVRGVSIASALPTEAAIVVDDPAEDVAVFVVSKPGVTDPLAQDQADEQLMAGAAGLTINAVFNRQPFTTYDGFSATTSQRIIVGGTSADAVRDELVRAVIEHPPGDLTIPAAGSAVGAGAPQYTLIVTTVARADRVVILGAVAPTTSFNDGAKLTSIRMRDATNATGLGRAGKGLAAECDDFEVTSLPIADIVWIIDDSGSMNDDQQRLAQSATEFFNKLQGSGIDFRLGVLRADCFATPSLTGGSFTVDQTTFEAQVQNPQSGAPSKQCESETPVTAGQNLYNQLAAAPPVTQPGDMSQGLRPNAELIYVFATDEEERNLQSGDIDSRNLMQTDIEALPAFQTLLSFYQTQGITAFGMIALAPTCTNQAEPSWAAKSIVENTGGAAWPVCMSDLAVLNAALSALISAAQGISSTFILSRVPISSTLKLAVETNIIPRGASNGFDYDGPNNAIIFNLASSSPLFPKIGDTVFVSYRFFEDAPILE